MCLSPHLTYIVRFRLFLHHIKACNGNSFLVLCIYQCLNLSEVRHSDATLANKGVCRMIPQETPGDQYEADLARALALRSEVLENNEMIYFA